MKDSHTKNDLLVLYTAKDIQQIFKLDSISSARRLMNHPSFPAMKIGRSLRVTKYDLVRFIESNHNSYIDLI